MSAARIQNLVFVILCMSQTGFGFIQGNLQFGVRSVDDVSQNIQSLSVLIEPLPLVPVAAGVKATQLPENASETALEVQAWLPMVPLITPFAYVDVMVQSNLDAGESDGLAIGVGFERGVLPFINATFSIESGNRRFTPSDSSLPDATSNYLAFLVGMQAGF